MQFAGVTDVFSCSSGHTRTKGNFMKATFEALRSTYTFITPDLWEPVAQKKNPYQEHSDFLADNEKKMAVA